MDFDIIKYLEGRKEYLRAKISIADRLKTPGSIESRCLDARMSEIVTLLEIVQGLKEAGNDLPF